MADCQKDAVPPSLLALVNMILDGSNIKHQTEHTASAHSTAMLCQSMDITKEAVQCLNREQIPVLTADQPLFAMLREIQWTFSRPPAKMQSKQKKKNNLLPLRVTVDYSQGCKFLVKQDMGICMNCSLMKTMPFNQLYQQVANCELE